MPKQKLVIAEKPSVGMALAKVLGCHGKRNGYMIGSGYIVSWCIGHLAGLADAAAYDASYAKWRWADLPIIPENWRFTLDKGKTEQFAVLQKLMRREEVTEVINACDAGREGELIFRTVYHLAGCDKPMKRLWISSMEDSAIREGFANLRPGSDYDGLYHAALCRAKADWLVGINATRLFSVMYRHTLNVGRVLSPTLALLVQREAEIGAFEPTPFYTVELNCGGVTFAGERLSDKADSAFSADDLEHQCGYMDGNLLPLSRERAAELLERDMTVYAVQTGENPVMVFDAEEIAEQPANVMFAVPREEWEASQDFQQAVADRMNHQEERERAFLDHGGDCFAIYQLRHDDSTRNLVYEPLERIRQAGESPRKGNYELVYTGELTIGQDLGVLDKLWEQFNINHPVDYQHPSMSISDIIALKQDGMVSCHYVDRLGFSALPGFFQPENYLKNAEMAMEDDYSMIDGIINNGPKEPTVAQLEQQARSGQPISLMDLAAATHREERERKQSVREKLKSQPKSEQKWTAPKRSAERDR